MPSDKKASESFYSKCCRQIFFEYLTSILRTVSSGQVFALLIREKMRPSSEKLTSQLIVKVGECANYAKILTTREDVRDCKLGETCLEKVIVCDQNVRQIRLCDSTTREIIFLL